ncbi:MAG TPA: hypothetical protein VLK33_05130 [Terriglobales bacterium]|nr:hypothetical protein [Terriglobales bacterium]
MIGVYGPTSTAGVFSTALWTVYFLILIGVSSLLMIRKGGISGYWQFANSILLITLIVLGTVISPFYEYRWGGLIGYVALALLLTLNFRNVSGRNYLPFVFKLTNIINIVFGAAIVLGSEPVRAAFVQYYSAFSPDLVDFMTSIGKPVLTFGTHSLAAFFFYLLFWMNFETYKIRGRYHNLVAAVGYVVLGCCLLSMSAFILMPIAIFQIVWYAAHKHFRLTIAALSMAVVLTVYIVQRSELTLLALDFAESSVTSHLPSSTSGLEGRFSELGTLHTTVAYLKDRPFMPVGVGYRSDLFFGDSGPVEYYLRGTILLAISIYAGLFAFLRKNLISKSDAYHLFAVIIGFELGLTALGNIRVLCFLPVAILYLNDLRRLRQPSALAV